MNYIGLDGDSIGRTVESFLIRNEIEKLKIFSQKIESALAEIEQKALAANGEIIFCTGDSILFYGDFELAFAEEIVHIFHKTTGKTASIGIGNTLAQAYLGLKLAKAQGGNQAVQYQMK